MDRPLDACGKPRAVTADSAIRVEPDYRDAWGHPRAAPPETVSQLGAALALSAREGTMVRCFEPNGLKGGERLWGISVQLYALRSPRNWGIGDFTDLQNLVARTALLGADFIGLNPLHALYAGDPLRISPYAPSSREFLNTLYIDPLAMQAIAIAPAARRSVAAARFQDFLTALRATELVEYVRVARCKEAIFREIFAAFEALRARAPRHAMVAAFDRFVQERGESLQRFAAFQALSCSETFGPGWMSWPEAYHDPSGDAVRDFATRNSAEIRYHAFLQWEADAQLANCAQVARASGMRLGLYLDLAIGAPPESAETWGSRHKTIAGFHIGAPPDNLSLEGQDWGLAAYDPYALARTGYRPLRAILDAVMRHAAIIRIDHILGFYRLFLVPVGHSPRDGVYLRLPVEALCDALGLESVARRCLVVGEDLGTIPEDFQGLLATRNILSYRLLIFARDGERFIAPEEYPRDALVAIGTHDLPPLLGYWSASDLRMRSERGLFSDDQTRQLAFAERERDRAALAAALRNAGFECLDDRSLLAAAHGFLARTPCRLFLVQMEDLACEERQVNVPGTGDPVPNWRRKLSRDVEAILDDPRAAAVLAAVQRERPSGRGA